MAGISESQWVEFQMSMAIVEDDESQSLKNIEQNILRSAKQCSSKDRWIAKNAKSNLDRWVMILGKFKG